MKYKFLEHTADIKIQSFGKNINEVFENSVLAISEYISRGAKIKSIKEKSINITGENIESMYYQFLEEIIYLLDAEGFIASNAKITIKDNNIRGKILGDDSKNYKNLDHIKAATYAEMYIKKTPSGWQAQCVLDV
ncbi:MAG: archease [Nanoarchaeota archaeon]|nr:archease [Nanoarchaeota archaeon]